MVNWIMIFGILVVFVVMWGGLLVCVCVVEKVIWDFECGCEK